MIVLFSDFGIRGPYVGQMRAALHQRAPFWYINSNGLVEIVVNQGSAARLLEIGVGSEFSLVPP